MMERPDEIWGVEVDGRIIYEVDSKRYDNPRQQALNWAKRNLKRGSYDIVGLGDIYEHLYY